MTDRRVRPLKGDVRADKLLVFFAAMTAASDQDLTQGMVARYWVDAGLPHSSFGRPRIAGTDVRVLVELGLIKRSSAGSALQKYELVFTPETCAAAVKTTKEMIARLYAACEVASAEKEQLLPSFDADNWQNQEFGQLFESCFMKAAEALQHALKRWGDIAPRLKHQLQVLEALQSSVE